MTTGIMHVTLEGDLLRAALARFGGDSYRDAAEHALRLYLGDPGQRPYEICGAADPGALCEIVNEKIAAGYEPHGPVFLARGGDLAQAVLRPPGAR